jgi:hypothetical protein
MSQLNPQAFEIGFATVWPPWFGLKNTIWYTREGAIARIDRQCRCLQTNLTNSVGLAWARHEASIENSDGIIASAATRSIKYRQSCLARSSRANQQKRHISDGNACCPDEWRSGTRS